MSARVETPPPESSPPSQEEDARSAKRHAGEQFVVLLAAIAIALGIRVFVVEPFRIPSGSMLPTLYIGDHLFVNKFVYGARIPGTDLRLPAWRDPRRGEVVVFSVARDGSQTEPADRAPEWPREQYVKRIVGLPGDRIDIVDEVVFVNGEPISRERGVSAFADETGRDLRVDRVLLPERSFRVLDDPGLRSRSGNFEVEPQRYFVLGDNRDYSKDSRFWGTVHRDELHGPAFLLYWSWDFNGDWVALLDPRQWWGSEVRWSRIGRPVE
ncbi:MAG: signal peptidase I [Myxococcota bacterium]